MSQFVEPKSCNYRHGIISQNCLVIKYTNYDCVIEPLSAGTFVRVYLVRDQDVFFHKVLDDMRTETNEMVCKKGDIINVPDNLWGPLFAVKKVDRLSLVRDSKIAESIGNISVGHAVEVLDNENSFVCVAEVTFKNYIPQLGPGIYFGLRILDSKENLERIIDKVSLLKPGTKGFPRDCNVVISIDKIRPVNFSSSTLERKLLGKGFLTGESINSGKSGLVYYPKEKNAHACSVTSGADSSLKKLINTNNLVDLENESEAPDKGMARWVTFDEDLKAEAHLENTCTHSLNEFFKSSSRRPFICLPSELTKLSDYQKNCSNKAIHMKKNVNKTKNINNNVKSAGIIVNNNNDNQINNNRNNNNDFYGLNEEVCCERNPLADGMYRKGKTGSCGCGSGKEEIFEGKELFKSSSRTDFDFESQRSSKSFDYSKPSEKKVNYKRHCNSMDSGMCKESCNSRNGQIRNVSSHEEYSGAGQELDHFGHFNCDKKFLGSNDGEPGVSNGKDKWDGECWSSDENISHSSDTIPEDLGIGSVVELTFKGVPHYGVIRWIGRGADDGEDVPSRIIAGIEMEKESPDFTDGTFRNKQYFQCNPKKALFVPLSKCRKDSRFLDEPSKQSLPPVNYGQIDCPIVEGTIPPINRKGDVESICGKNRGIQGHHNSCYLDATLFSMFAFTSVFDSLLYRPPTKSDIPQYSEVQKVLREEIVNPLRKNLYVRADRVMKLRTLLEKLSSVSGLTSEEKDPEEFLNSLLAQILKAEPFLKLSSGQEAFHYQLFVEKDERLVLPTVQQLFEQSFVASDIKLKQIPSCLIIQMPRFGKSFKMYSRILPPQLLDITDIIEHSPRQCTVCGKLAEFECKDCFGQQGIGNGLESISFCKSCLDTAHNHHCRSRHNSRALTVPLEFYELQEHCVIPRIYMELFAVVCIETSHYVAFVKCGSGPDAPWCFFDSMADRKGEQNGYNIPEMVPCPDLPYWLSEDGARMLNEMRDERQLPEHAKRLFSDAYMCMYQSPDLMMYR